MPARDDQAEDAMNRVVGACLWIAAVPAAACGEDPAADEFGNPATPPEEDDLVAETDGKADTGYLSTLATELEGEFAGEVRLDVSGETPEARDRLLAELRGSPWRLKNVVIDQVKFSKKMLNTEKLHMNLYSDRVEAEEITLDGTTISIRYKARLESVVSHPELERAGLSIERILADPTTTLRLPADPRNIFSRVADRCAVGFDPGDLADFNYFYYFDPDKPGCDMPLVEATFTVSSLAPPAATTYPEYDKLAADGKVTVFVVFGQAGHEAEVPASDWGVREWNQFKREIFERGFRKASDLAPGERFVRVRAGIEQVVDIVSPYDLKNQNATDRNALFRRALGQYEIILYNGHSFYGSLDVLRDCSAYAPDTYQIVYMGSCWSYEYYTTQVFECKKTASDPLGWDLADVVNDTEAGWFHNSAEFARILLTNLLAGVETGGRDGNRYYTWFNIISAMNEYAIETYRRWGTETHEIMGVSGVRNNRYDPEATPGSGGARFESGSVTPIPDDTPAGVSSEIVVTSSIRPRRITVAVNITHTYIGDLTVVLRRNAVDIPLRQPDRRGWEDDIIGEFEITDPRLLGQDAAGSWFLHVADTVALDTGRINTWAITLAPQ